MTNKEIYETLQSIYDSIGHTSSWIPPEKARKALETVMADLKSRIDAPPIKKKDFYMKPSICYLNMPLTERPFQIGDYIKCVIDTSVYYQTRESVFCGEIVAIDETSMEIHSPETETRGIGGIVALVDIKSLELTERTEG